MAEQLKTSVSQKMMIKMPGGDPKWLWLSRQNKSKMKTVRTKPTGTVLKQIVNFLMRLLCLFIFRKLLNFMKRLSI
jgi:hypothetical protein